MSSVRKTGIQVSLVGYEDMYVIRSINTIKYPCDYFILIHISTAYEGQIDELE